MATLTDILQSIRDNIVDVPDTTELHLVEWVNEAQQEIEAAHQWLALETVWVATTLEGNNQIRQTGGPSPIYKPADWIVAIGDPWWRVGDTGATVKMEWLPSLHDVRKEHPQYTSTDSRGRPNGLWEQAAQIDVYPTPDAENELGDYSIAGEYEIIVPYRKREATLVSGGTETNFFTDTLGHQLFLQDYASGKASLFNRDIAGSQLFLSQAANHLKREKRMDKRQRLQYLRITPRRDVHASRRQRRAI